MMQNLTKQIRQLGMSGLALMLATSLLFITACGDDDQPAQQDLPDNVVQVAIDNGYNVLAAALVEAGLDFTLQQGGPYTVFAPTDAAFNSAGITVDNVGEVDNLSEILQYHVVAGEITSDQLSTGQVETLSGDLVDIDASALTVDGANIVDPFDVEASNGVIHTIDGVLSLPVTVVDQAVATSDLSILVQALTKFPDLVEALSDQSGNYTVFAPTDDAFTSLLGVVGQDGLDDIPDDVLKRILQYHVVAGTAAQSGDLTDGQEIETLLEENVTIGVGSDVTVDGATVTTPDVLVDNGVIHVIDAVITPELETSIVNTVVEPAYFNKDFTILTDAVVKAELLSTLIDSQSEFTVFAPTNSAFEAAGITSLDGLTKEDLTPILQYHVLGSEVKEADLPASGSAVTTLNGDFYLSINTDGVFINGTSQVTATDIDQDNGVVHVIDKTLVPASQNVVDIAVELSQASSGAEFTQLVAALTAVENDQSAPDLITALSGEGPFTVFAPTDAAFENLYALVGDANSDGSEDLNDVVAAAGIGTVATVLQYHVLDTRAFSTDIPVLLGGSNKVTLNPLDGGSFDLNSDLTITDADQALGLGTTDATIIATDELATNGVIHTIDEVILP